MTCDSGGPGRWRGQPGTLNVKKILEPTTAVAWMVSMKHPLRGLRGGDDASAYSNTFEVGTPNAYKIENSVRAELPAGAVCAYQYGGGAGFGSALLRDPEAVREDVLTGSAEKCDVEVDLAATERLRERLTRERR
jgi:N-methylhydantoinase B